MPETSSASRSPGAEERFIDYLRQLSSRQDRAALSALRRVLGKQIGDIPQADRILLPWIPAAMSDRRAASWYLVAGLFACHPAAAQRRGSLGTALRQLKEARKGAEAGVERRFEAALQSHPDELADHLRRFVQLLKAAAVPVDWVQLLRDVPAWGDDERRVQRRWARDFWGSTPAAETVTDNNTLAESSVVRGASHDR